MIEISDGFHVDTVKINWKEGKPLTKGQYLKIKKFGRVLKIRPEKIAIKFFKSYEKAEEMYDKLEVKSRENINDEK